MTLDELAAYGMERMDEPSITTFLQNQRIGVLGLSDDGAPLILPMSFGFDGEGALLFTFVLGSSSRKGRLAREGDRASFLTYSVDSAFNWESVSLAGSFERVPESEWETHENALDEAWRPSLFESAGADSDVAVYLLDVEEWTGVRHTGLPPGFDHPDD